jgi:DNA-binding GntR family transcriptional regulator
MMMRKRYREYYDLLVRFLRLNPGQRFAPKELEQRTGVPRKFVARLLMTGVTVTTVGRTNYFEA